MKFKIFLINMRKSADRLAFMSNQLAIQKMEFTRQEGVDGQTHDFGGLCSEKGEKSLTQREKGIALSHKMVLENFLKEDLRFAIVMEDDIELPDNFRTIVEREMIKRDAGKTRWEYLSFNYPTVGVHFIRLWIFLFLRMAKTNRSILFYFKLPLYFLKFIFIVFISAFERIREKLYGIFYDYGKPSLFYRPLYLAGCYLITRKGAEKLLSLNEKLTYTADELPNAARIKKGLKFYAFVPLSVKQRRDKFFSKLEADREYFFSN